MLRQPLTEPTPQRVPEGFLLTANERDGRRSGYSLLFGLVWTAFTSWMLFFVLSEESWLTILFPLFIIGLFEAIGLLIVGGSLLEIWASLKLRVAELILPKYPLRLGETCSIHYRRKLRNGTFSRPGEIVAQLVCDEWVQYTQGTDTVMKTHVLLELQLPARTVVTGECQADYDGEIAIASEAPPSFSAKHNQVRWRLIVKLKVPGIPLKRQSEFLLQVAPEKLMASSM